MSGLNTGAGLARIIGMVCTLVAVVLAGATGLVYVSLPPAPSTDDWITLATVAVLSVVLAGIGLPLWVLGGRRLARQRRVLQTGTPCLATISAIDAMSTDPDERPLSRIDLVVPLPVGGSTDAVVRQVVPLAQVRHLRPGVQVPVRVDPADPTFVVIDWQYLLSRTPIAASVAASVGFDAVLNGWLG